MKTSDKVMSQPNGPLVLSVNPPELSEKVREQLVHE